MNDKCKIKNGVICVSYLIYLILLLDILNHEDASKKQFEEQKYFDQLKYYL
jgi:hypothetical protein